MCKNKLKSWAPIKCHEFTFISNKVETQEKANIIERLKLCFNTKVCITCADYHKTNKILSRLIKKHYEKTEHHIKLPEEVKEKIRITLQNRGLAG